MNLATETLTRGCADLVIGGHLHVEDGPEAITGPDGLVGYRYTMGTTGGAAYAFALGSKPRREAQVTLVTYADGRPVGLQGVFLQTNGRWDVGEYVELTRPEEPGADTELPTPTRAPDSGPATGPSRSGGPADPGDDID